MEFKKKVIAPAEKPKMSLPNLRAAEHLAATERLREMPPGNHANLLKYAAVHDGPFEFRLYVFDILSCGFLLYHPKAGEFQMDGEILAEISFGNNGDLVVRNLKLQNLARILPKLMLQAMQEAK